MNISFKKLHDGAETPRYAKHGDAGMDLTVTEVEKTLFTVKYKFGIATQLPEHTYAKILARSSVKKTLTWLSNACGIIDSGYRGEIMAVFYKIPLLSKCYKVGERAVQMIVTEYEPVTFVERKKLDVSERGEGGYGSSGS